MTQSIAHRLMGAAALIVATLAATSTFADNKAAMIADTCAGCHGTDGASRGPASPTIASLSKEYFVISMKEFKSGKRPATVMDRIAKGYTDDEIEALANFFQAKPFIRTHQKIDPAEIKKGKELAKKYCSTCHEEEGKSGEGVGVLAGQWFPYLQVSMQDFLAGKRETEKRQKAKFDAVIAEQGVEAFQDILRYYANVK